MPLTGLLASESTTSTANNNSFIFVIIFIIKGPKENEKVKKEKMTTNNIVINYMSRLVSLCILGKVKLVHDSAWSQHSTTHSKS